MPNLLVAALVSASMAVAGILLLLPPVRALLKLVLYKPGKVKVSSTAVKCFFNPNLCFIFISVM